MQQGKLIKKQKIAVIFILFSAFFVGCAPMRSVDTDMASRVVQCITALSLAQENQIRLIDEVLASKNADAMQKVETSVNEIALEEVVKHIARQDLPQDPKNYLINKAFSAKECNALLDVKIETDKQVAAQNTGQDINTKADSKNAAAENTVAEGSSHHQGACDRILTRLDLGMKLTQQDLGYYVDNCK